MVLVCDASALILLQKAGLLEKTAKIAKVIAASHVYREAVIKGKERSFQDAYALEDAFSKGLISEEQPKNAKKVFELMVKFGTARGESETIALCLEKKKAVAGVDDKKAMNICDMYGLPFVTALTLVVASCKEGLITKANAAEMIEKLRVHGRYRGELINEALKALEGGGK